MAVDIENFKTLFKKEFQFSGPAITLGAPTIEGHVLTNELVKIPLKTMNRHGLIAGATGTGKTKSLQLVVEELSKQGVPSLVMDIKGDLSGLAKPGAINDKVSERIKKIGVDYKATGFPVEFLSLSKQPGTRLRSTVLEFGPVLLAKALDLNDTQRSLLSLIFKFADDRQLPLLDLKDFKTMLAYIQHEGKEEVVREFGAVSSSSAATILRKVIELEQQGATTFFGEPSFEVADLIRADVNGRGYVSVIRLIDIQDKPNLFSTFMLSLLAEIFYTMPEVGDLEKPKLCIFIDEAHLVFEEASKELLNQLETTIKLIRSKGVGIFFITQNPTDIPSDILGQLGLKIQHALRAFTANDNKAIKQAANNFPVSDFYKTDEILLSLGTGEALVTALSEKGKPTLLVACYISPPASRMDILNEHELNEIINHSHLTTKYNVAIDRESAHEILTRRVTHQKPAAAPKGRSKESSFEDVLKKAVTRRIGYTIANALVRGMFGALKRS